MPLSGASLSDIAHELKVSTTAVSLALRGKPGVSEKLRLKVLQCAEQRGYHPNPVAAELMSIVRSRRSVPKSGGAIAFINPFSDSKLLDRYDFHMFYDGAKRRAKDFGYEMEVFVSSVPGMTGARMTKILQARGIRGVLVGARLYDDPEFQLDWSAFSAVLIGEIEYHQNISRVCNYHTHTCSLAIARLYEKGYRRIGVALMDRYEASRKYSYAIGIDQFTRSNKVREGVDLYLYNDFDKVDFKKWCSARAIDAVISLEAQPGMAVAEWNAGGGNQIGYACLSVLPVAPWTGVEKDSVAANWSGVNQHSEEIGSSAMDLLRSMLLAGERGISSKPKLVLVEGEWVEGNSAPGPKAPKAKAKARNGR